MASFEERMSGPAVLRSVLALLTSSWSTATGLPLTRIDSFLLAVLDVVLLPPSPAGKYALAVSTTRCT